MINPYNDFYLQHGSDNKHVCFTVSPLKSLMADQVQGLMNRGIKAVALTANTSEKRKQWSI